MSKLAHGTQSVYLVENILRERIFESRYWKERCLGVNAASILDLAYDLTHIGGAFSNQIPTDFLCLTLKLLHLFPQKEILHVYIQQSDFKYIRALGAFVLRLIGDAKEVYLHLEPLLEDKRKLRLRQPDGRFVLTYMDVFVDQLLHEERVCDTILPRLTRRDVLEDVGDLEPRVSPLEDEFDAMMAKEEEERQRQEQEAARKTTSHRLRLKEKTTTQAVSDNQVATSSSAGGKDELSIEEINRLRLSLGLKPLK